MAKCIKVFAPASVGNACVGFDVLGFAVERPGDEIILKTKEEKGVVIKEITGDQGKLSLDPTKNTATIPIQVFLDEQHIDTGVEVILNKKMPFGSGLGSSAASAVAGAYAVNALFDSPCSREEVLKYAMEGEFLASGAHHADNVAPCLYGGLTLIRSHEPFDVINIPVPEELYVTLIYPEVEIKTSEARSILPYEVPVKTAAKQWANLGAFVTGMLTKDFDLISRSMHDYIAEPYRAKLIPEFAELKKKALASGALGFSISGSGPTMFSFCQGREKAEICGQALSDHYSAKSIKHQTFVSQINTQGPLIIP